jgi:hypothetical protein
VSKRVATLRMTMPENVIYEDVTTKMRETWGESERIHKP